MKKVTHLLLDLDGTLVEGDDLGLRLDYVFRSIQSWNLKQKGYWKILQAFRAMRLAAEGPPNHETIDVRIVGAFARTFQLSDTEARRILETSVLDIFPRLRRHFYPVPGASRFIGWAKQRYPLILATNPIWIPEAVQWRVQWAGLDLSQFASFTHAARMHACKPHVAYYEELLEQEKLDPAQCLLVGNDERKDLPATRAGIRVFLVNQKKKKSMKPSQSIAVPRGSAAAWWGTYPGLQELLESWDVEQAS